MESVCDLAGDSASKSMEWVASNFWTVSAVWNNHEALAKHFKEAKSDPMKDKKKNCTYEGFQPKMTNICIITHSGANA
jgi:hypothetical protein